MEANQKWETSSILHKQQQAVKDSWLSHCKLRLPGSPRCEKIYWYSTYTWCHLGIYLPLTSNYVLLREQGEVRREYEWMTPDYPNFGLAQRPDKEPPAQILICFVPAAHGLPGFCLLHLWQSSSSCMTLPGSLSSCQSGLSTCQEKVQQFGPPFNCFLLPAPQIGRT